MLAVIIARGSRTPETSSTLASPVLSGTATGALATSGTTTILPSGALVLTGTAEPSVSGLVLVTATTMKIYLTATTGIIVTGTGNTTF